MKRRQETGPEGVEALATALDEALELLHDFRQESGAVALHTERPASLLDQCVALCDEYVATPQEPVRTVHHFACTGGSLLCKCIAAMPNTQVLSEVDPLSTLGNDPHVHRFAPTDMIQLMRQSTRGVNPQVLIELFLGNLDIIHSDAAKAGQRLVLRDHAHSHFCSGPGIPDRPSFRTIVQQRLPVLSVLTVRHPIDSYLSLKANGWLHFDPQTFDEYCRRYLAFLALHEDVPVIKYEEFTHRPQEIMREVCAHLQLPFSEQFPELFGVFTMSGDSGRKSESIGARTRRESDTEALKEMTSSRHYRRLQHLLDYD
jgi:hypothetical protein